MSATSRTATSGSPRIVARRLRKEFVDISRQAEVVALSSIDLDIGEETRPEQRLDLRVLLRRQRQFGLLPVVFGESVDGRRFHLGGV